jgi:hypothetical protein
LYLKETQSLLPKETQFLLSKEAQPPLPKPDLTRLLQIKSKIHRRDLPPPPKWHKDLRVHPLGDHFRQAEDSNLQSHKEMNTWEAIDVPTTHGRLTLDCVWVYVYKFKKHGYY